MENSNARVEDSFNGDMILIDRLASFLEKDRWEWDRQGIISLDDISDAISNGQVEESAPYGDTWRHLPEERSRNWHIGRIIYFINHKDEIKDIEIDSECYEWHVLPDPIITDGNHRLLAAIWLQKEGNLKSVHCWFDGRVDLLDYLTGKTDERLFEV